MRGFPGFVLVIVSLAASSCGSDDAVNLEDAVARIDDLRVELPCLGAGSSDVNCYVTDVDEESATIEGDAGATYDVTVRLRGVVEQKTYSDYTGSDGLWIEGGTPDGGSWNIFMLHVSSPEKTYYMNSGSSGIDECFLLDVQKTIVMDHGSVLTLTADSGGDNYGTKNMDGYGDPIVVNGVSPYPGAFDGQFVQMDVVDIKLH